MPSDPGQVMSVSKTKRKAAPAADDFLWLSQVREVLHPLDDANPIFVREVSVLSGDPTPQPSVPFPERHPYCEFNINVEGLSTQLICEEKVERKAGDIMLVGPGVPHFAFRHSPRYRTITVYFLPRILFEMAPNGGGSWILSRFTMPQDIGQRVLRPPPKLSGNLVGRMEAMAKESRERKPGFDLRLWGMLVESLVEILRWGVSTEKWTPTKTDFQDWTHLEKALRYLHEHYAEPLYTDQIAAAVGLTTNRLRELFRQTLATSCSHYLSTLRISQAKSLLGAPNAQVSEVALQVGFETLSNFTASFRKLTGLSPTQYMQSLPR